MKQRCAVCGAERGSGVVSQRRAAFICDACAARIRWEARERVGPLQPR